MPGVLAGVLTIALAQGLPSAQSTASGNRPQGGTAAAPQQAAPQQPAGQGAGAASGTQAAAQPGGRPTFRVEANLVRVDAIVTTKDGEPVRDLTAADFELLEDGTPQKLSSFERVDITETRLTSPERRDPTTAAEARQIAAEDPRARVFVLFLDRYHTGIAGSHRMQTSLSKLLDRVIGPDDLIAVMTPDMSASDVTFTRRTGPISSMLAKNWTWGVRDQAVERDPEEQMYEACYPDSVPAGATAPAVPNDPQQPAGTPAGMYEGGRAPVKPVAQEMISRRREKRTLDALTDLAVFLRGVREERKAVIVVSDGWVLYRPDERLTRRRQGEAVPGTGIPGTDPQGRLVPDAARARTSVGSGGGMYECDAARQRLANIDDRQTYMDLMQTANRANVSFYPVDSRGLAVFDTDMGETFVTPGGGQSVLSPAVDQRMLSNRIETLTTLAANTDGIAVVNRNDIDKGLERVVADLSSYYLMSYYSTNTALDGKYRTISVKVKRPGVEVRARKGYRAATAEEMSGAPTASASTASTAVQYAFGQLGPARSDLPLRSHVAWLSSTDGGRVFASVELDPRTVKQAEWGGAWKTEFTLTDVKGTQVLARATADGTGLPASRAEALLTPNAGLGAGEYLLRARVTPASGGLPLTDSVRFTVPQEVTAAGSPMFSRRNATTGRAYLRTSDLRFTRTDWVRVTVPVTEAPASVTAELVDQRGQVMAIPVTARAEKAAAGDVAIGELSLAPLAAGEYAVRLVIEIGGTKLERLAAFRVVTS